MTAPCTISASPIGKVHLTHYKPKIVSPTNPNTSQPPQTQPSITSERDVLTFARDVGTVPGGLPVDGQTLGPGEAVGHVSGVTVVLEGRVQIERRLFGEGVVSGVINGRR